MHPIELQHEDLMFIIVTFETRVRPLEIAITSFNIFENVAESIAPEIRKASHIFEVICDLARTE